MSTELRDTDGGYGPHRISGYAEVVTIEAVCGPHAIVVDTTRADFLAAVASELDVTIIENAALPGVVDIGGGRAQVGIDPRDTGPSVVRTAAHHMGKARRQIALALHAAGRDAIAEAKVEALTRILHEPYPDSLTWEQNRDIARRLLATGRIEVKP